MPLVMNGVIIPENVANAFMFNGVSVTDVFMNGVQVFNQSLFSATWSGSTKASALSGLHGIETSGSLHRATGGSSENSKGIWLTSNSSGLAVGETKALYGWTSNYMKFNSTAISIDVRVDTYTGSGACSFGIGVGFSGTSIAGINTIELQTSGGTIRMQVGVEVGAWISLT